MNFPPHLSLTLYHNEHKGYYETVQEYLERGAEESNGLQWADDQSRQACIDTDELWQLTWYPKTPVGSYTACAPTLEQLLAFADTFPK